MDSAHDSHRKRRELSQGRTLVLPPWARRSSDVPGLGCEGTDVTVKGKTQI